MTEENQFDWQELLLFAVLLSPVWVPMLIILFFGLAGAVRFALGHPLGF